MIKAYSIRIEEDKKTIDTHLRIDKELEVQRKLAFREEAMGQDGTFVEGLQAVVVEQVPSLEEHRENAARIIENAEQEAKGILEKAKKDAEVLKNEAFETARKKGYEEGTLQSRKEFQRLQAEYDEKSKNLQLEFEHTMQSMEPQMAEIIASLVEKITGVVIEGREEVIMYLIDKTFQNIEKCDEYTVRVSKENYEYISLRKNLLLSAIGREVNLNILEDASLKSNQCLIETEQKVINCSLDVQLRNLITDLKLIAGI
jgi:flagellar assembly protein FliH